MENLLAHGEGNNDRNELVGSQPTLRDGDKTSKASDFSSNFWINDGDTDVSIGNFF